MTRKLGQDSGGSIGPIEPALIDPPSQAAGIDPDTGELIATAPTEDPAHPTVNDRPTTVAGERSIPSVNRERSIRTRLHGMLALGLLALLGLGFLAWYYATQFARADAQRVEARRTAEGRIEGEVHVQPLGRIDPPQPQAHATPVSATAGALLGPAPPPPSYSADAGPSGAPQKSPEQLALERKLGQPVLLRGQSGTDGVAVAGAPPAAPSPPDPLSLATILGNLQAGPPGAEPATAPAPGTASLATLLRPTSTPAVAAQVLPTRRFLLPKGAFVDCTLETAIDSSLDGMVTCIGASDIYSADGKVVLLERGTKYVGEKRGDPRQGQGRVFVLWEEARTPTGVSVNLASPGTDELGRSGLPGHVDTHFWDRFGAAILISVIDGTLQALAASQQRGDATVVLNPQGSREILTEVLKGTVAIPPTVLKNQGDRIQVLVARDVDFRSVYALRTESVR